MQFKSRGVFYWRDTIYIHICEHEHFLVYGQRADKHASRSLVHLPQHCHTHTESVRDSISQSAQYILGAHENQTTAQSERKFKKKPTNQIITREIAIGKNFTQLPISYRVFARNVMKQC